MRIYPLIVHLPLLILLNSFTKRWLWPVVSILSVYLFCQMRRWLALLTALVLDGEEMTRILAEMVFTLPLLLIFLRFAAPVVRQLMECPVKTQLQFSLIPTLYYGFDYLTRVYTDFLSRGGSVVVEFMPTVCCGAYLVFLLYNAEEEHKRSLLRQTRDSLNLRVAQATQKISALRESQALTAWHRHDLRHHLQYLLSCIENEQLERAKDYISGICAELEAQKVRRYCENEAANLIRSAFARRAEKIGVEMDVQGSLPALISVSDNDLCVILSNALEMPSTPACLWPRRERTVSSLWSSGLRRRTGGFLCRSSIPARGEVRFEKGLPVFNRSGHGIGARSIRTVVERYGGGCTFLSENGQFILRLFL